MPLEVKQLSCPNCGSPLNIKNAARSRSVVCTACNSQIDLTAPPYSVMGNVGQRRPPKLRQFTVGMTGKLLGDQHEIIGRVVYMDNEGYDWDEWLLLSAAGDYRWLSDDEDEGMVAWHAFTPTQPLDPNTVHQGQTIDLSGVPARVTEVTHATIVYLEGELTWKAGMRDTMQALDAAGPHGEMFAIEWTTDEIEFYKGERQNPATVAAAFGLPVSLATRVGAAGGRKAGKAASLAAVLVVSIIVISVLFCCGATFAGGGIDCRATPAAVRSSSCTSSGFGSGGGHSSGGGGFGGGGGSGK